MLQAQARTVYLKVQVTALSPLNTEDASQFGAAG